MSFSRVTTQQLLQLHPDCLTEDAGVIFNGLLLHVKYFEGTFIDSPSLLSSAHSATG